MLFDLNFDTRFGTLSSFIIYYDTIYHFRVLNSLATKAIIAPKMPAGRHFLETVNFDDLIIISVKNCTR